MAGEFIHEMSQRAENSLKHPTLLACFIEKINFTESLVYIFMYDVDLPNKLNTAKTMPNIQTLINILERTKKKIIKAFIKEK
jgi:hypothetical protein